MVKHRGLNGSGELLGGSGAALGRHLAPRPPWAAFWVRFGQLLGGSGSVFGGSWAVLGTKLGRPGASWMHLGGVLMSCSDLYALSHSLSSAFYIDRLLDRKCLILDPFSEGQKPIKR